MFGLGGIGLLGDEEVATVFVRARQYLNIPKRGDGENGDPNLSIVVTDEIQEVITRLLSDSQQ